MRAGQLQQRISWQQYTLANVSGQAVPTYSTVGTYWASVEPLNGKEGIVARQLRADVTHSVKMYRVGNIKAKDRLTYKGRILEITSVLNIDEVDVASAQLNLICVEVV